MTFFQCQKRPTWKKWISSFWSFSKLWLFYSTDTSQHHCSIDCHNTTYIFQLLHSIGGIFGKWFNPVLLSCKSVLHYKHITMQTGLHFHLAHFGRKWEQCEWYGLWQLCEASLIQTARTDDMLLYIGQPLK